MAIQGGMGDNLWVGGYDLSGDIGSLGQIACPRSVQDTTPINMWAYRRLLLRKDGAIDFTSFFNPSAGAAHPVLSALPTTDVSVAYCRGTSLGSPAACVIGKQIDYVPAEGADGSLTFTTNVQASGYGLEWGNLHTAGIRTDVGATSPATGVDGRAASLYGLQAYLHVFEITGTDATIKLQESSAVDGGGDAFADIVGGGFTALTGASDHTTQRIKTANDLAVERYIRVVTTTAAGFTSLSFGVIVVRNVYGNETF